MSAATRAATVVVVVLAIGAAAKAVQGGKTGDGTKKPDPIRTGHETGTAPSGSTPKPGDGTKKPDPIRTGDTSA